MNRVIIFVLVVIGLIGLIYLNNQPHPAVLQPQTASPSQTASKSLGSAMPFTVSIDSRFQIGLFASGLGGPRDLQFSPGGTLLVSNPSSNTVYALPDANHDGVADTTKTIINNENHVHGLAFYKGYLFVADVDKVVRYKWDETSLTATLDKILFPLPQNSDHNARTIVFDSQGNMFVSIGSTCNVCVEKSAQSATILISDQDGNNPRTFAKGLRNAAFMAFNPTSNELWSTEMGRDNLGDNIPPDELDIIHDNADYGWPYCYSNKVHDNNFDPRNQHDCSNTIPPLYHIPAHSAPLGLTFIKSGQFPKDWQGDLLVAYHGSWNRSSPIGYKVVHLKVNGNSITNSEDFITGFLPTGALVGPTSAFGRPVDLTFDNSGNLYISDDKAGNIYILTKN